MMDRKKILITGASGLLGKALLTHFIENRNYELYGVTTSKYHLSAFSNVTVVEADLTRNGQIAQMLEQIRPDILIHLAWYQGDGNFRNSEKNGEWLEISKVLLKKFVAVGGNQFVFAGSSSEYDGAAGCFSEEDDIEPKSEYGKAKKEFNQYALQFCADNQIDYIGLRLFTIYGENDRHDFGAIPQIFAAMKADTEIVCKSPYTTRDYIYAPDAARIITQLIEIGDCGIVNVGSGYPMTMKQVFETIGRVCNKQYLIGISDDNTVVNEFEADISKLRRLGVTEPCSDFEKNIRLIWNELMGCEKE